jgi:long-chain acyl-CoA synthetase
VPVRGGSVARTLWLMPNLANLLTRGGHVAIKLDDAELTYDQLDDAVARTAGLLKAKGVAPGDRVGVMLPNVPQFAVAYYGVLRAGGVVVPLNPLLKSREVSYHLADSGANLLLAWHESADAAHAGAEEAGADCVLVEPGSLEELARRCEPVAGNAPRAGDDTAIILYTSGTTGTPKGAQLTHANLIRNLEVSKALFGLDATAVTLGALPFFHAFGQTCALNATLAAGGTLTLLPRFDAEKALAIVERDGVSVFEGVPTMFSALLHADRDAGTGSLRVCVSGGAALPVEVLHAFERRFGAAVLEGYGLSETSPVACFNRPDRERKPGSIGLPVDGVEMKLVEDDEIAIRGHNVMKGYWNKPEATAEVLSGDGWFRTGDIGRVDEDGYFYVVDRKKELVIRGGYNVYPREIEEVLYEHPAVREAAVIGVPHDSLGEEVGAAIALKADVSVSPSELRAFVKSRVAAYKYPRIVWLLDELPKGPTGKILKRAIVPPSAREERRPS